MDVDLPEQFDARYKEILRKFSEVKDTYKYYADEIIPGEPEYVKEILQFLIDILDHVEINYEKVDLQQWSVFLHDFPFDFEYGDNQGDHNFLEFDELDLVTNLQKFNDEDTPSILQISSIRKKLEKAIKQF